MQLWRLLFLLPPSLRPSPAASVPCTLRWQFRKVHACLSTKLQSHGDAAPQMLAAYIYPPDNLPSPLYTVVLPPDLGDCCGSVHKTPRLCVFVCVSSFFLCLSVSLSVCVSVSLCLSLSLCLCLSVCLCLSLSLSLCLCPSVSLSLSLSLCWRNYVQTAVGATASLSLSILKLKS